MVMVRKHYNRHWPPKPAWLIAPGLQVGSFCSRGWLPWLKTINSQLNKINKTETENEQRKWRSSSGQNLCLAYSEKVNTNEDWRTSKFITFEIHFGN